MATGLLVLDGFRGFKLMEINVATAVFQVAGKSTMNEDVFPIQHEDFSIAMLVLGSVSEEEEAIHIFVARAVGTPGCNWAVFLFGWGG